MEDDCYHINVGGRNLKSVKDKNREEYIIPVGITSICKRAFKDCTSMKRVVIPNSVTTIGEKAFMNCPSIMNLLIPEGVESIGKYCFADCKLLKNVILPKSLKVLGMGCFSGCTNLGIVHILLERPDVLKCEDLWMGKPPSVECSLVVPSPSYWLYMSYPMKNQFARILQDGGEFRKLEIDCQNSTYKPFLIDQYYSEKELHDRGWTLKNILEYGKTALVKYCGINYFKKTAINRIENSEAFQSERALKSKCWRRDVLIYGRKWTGSLIDMLLSPALVDTVEYYIKDNVLEAEKTQVFQVFQKSLALEHLHTRGWTNSLMRLFLPKPDTMIDKTSYYLRETIERIEQSREFIKTRKLLHDCYKKKDLVERNWPDCLIDGFQPDLKDGEEFYYSRGRVLDYERCIRFREIKRDIKIGCWSKKELKNMGWTDFAIRFFVREPDYRIGNREFYRKQKIDELRNNNEYRSYLDSKKKNREYLLWLYRSGRINSDEFINELEFEIPMMSKDQLKHEACESYKRKENPNYPPSESDEDKNLAQLCMNYLRHVHTDYEDLLEKLGECVHQRLKIKVNRTIGNAYPWINKYADYF